MAGALLLRAHLSSTRNVSLGAVQSIANGYDCSMPVIRKKFIEQATIAAAILILALVLIGMFFDLHLK
ncbi:MAG: hypothetical protein P8Y71_29195 [Pseudolabrys sp.]